MAKEAKPAVDALEDGPTGYETRLSGVEQRLAMLENRFQEQMSDLKRQANIATEQVKALIARVAERKK